MVLYGGLQVNVYVANEIISKITLQEVREALFFGSRQLMVAKMNGRAGTKKTKKNKKTYDSGELLSSADAPYKRCVCQRNVIL